MSATATTDNPKQLFSRQSISLILPFFRHYAVRLILGFLALLGVDFLQLWIPRIIKKTIDLLEAEKATGSLLLHHAGQVILLALGIACCRFLWRYCVLGFSRLVERDLRERLLGRILHLDSSYFQRHPTGETMALSSNDLAAVQLACGMGLIAAVDAVVMTVAALGFMMYIHPRLTLIAVAPMPVLALATRLLSGLLHQRFKKVQEQFSKMTEFSRSSLNSIHLIKAYTQEKKLTERFAVLGETYIRNNLKLARIQGILFPFSGLIANLSLLLVLFFGGRLTIQQTISVGDFVAFISYLFMLTWPMMAIGWVTNLFQRGMTSLGRIKRVLDERPLLVDAAGARQTIAPPTEIELRHLGYVYPEQEEPALHDVTVTFTPGVVGIVGRTGAGKSTLCNILARLYVVREGCYSLDGRDVNNLSLAAVRRSIAYVPQQTTLFSETVFYNITLGDENARMDRVEEVARAASIHEEIMELADGYRTRVGERGVTLSGGQRQRIALARALLLDRPIVIIDDGLSAVDMETEHAIIRNMASFLAGRICIVVSHRVAPLIDAREILVMEEGSIVARGDHARLLAENSFYATIYHHQTAAFAKGRRG